MSRSVRGCGLPIGLLLALGSPLPAAAGTISTADIVSQTTSAAVACARWMPVGMCFWLRCSIYECSVETSLKVAHFQPDAVVSSYNDLGQNPWTEAASLYGSLQTSGASSALESSVEVGSAGNRSEGGRGFRDHRNLIFREADVIGHPVALLSEILEGTSYLCETETTAFYPYFLSGLDAVAWRSDAPESYYPASATPGMREIGQWPLYTWGSVYPRTGWVLQTDEPKAAAIAAQRAGDIATRGDQPHVYQSIEPTSSSDQRVWSPGPLQENESRTGEWQMHWPKAESACAVFGTNDLTDITSWGGGRVDEEGDYVWTLWRPYQCCEVEGAFLFDLNWIEYPP